MNIYDVRCEYESLAEAEDDLEVLNEAIEDKKGS